MAGKPPTADNRADPNWGELSWEDRSDELVLLDEGDRLPWLESSDDVAPASTVLSTRTIGLGLLALAVLALLIGGIWWLGSRNNGPVPDGSVIAAPEGPYKVRPADPGGKQHAGTGDTSFAVGEGQTREARLAEDVPAEAVPVPSLVTADTTSAPPPEPEPEIAAPSGVGVQVGAYYSTAAAERGWATLIRQTEALQGVEHRVVRGVADIGTVYRLQAVTPDVAAANRLCDALRTDGLNCQVKR